MRKIYTFLLYLALPGITLYLLWINRKNPGYRKRWGELFGCFRAPVSPGGIWLHAASVGEVNAAMPLIKAIQKSYPNEKMIITTQTATGSQRVTSVLGDSVFHVFVPLDVPDAISRFLNCTQPRLAIFMETELWPNKFAACKKRNIPLIIANARLTENSLAGYSRFHSLCREMLSHVTRVIAQTQIDADRYQALGLPVDKITIAGNLKFDVSLPTDIHERAQPLRHSLGEGRPIWIAASTHEGEEDVIVKAYAAAKKQINNLLLLLVPRHPERASSVAKLCQHYPFNVVLRSQQAKKAEEVDIFLGDSMGELLLFYACADVAFVGASLIPKGGHNIIEPILLGIPIITGPYDANIRALNVSLQEIGASVSVNNHRELADKVIFFLQDNHMRLRVGKQAKDIIAQSSGALETHMNIIKTVL